MSEQNREDADKIMEEFKLLPKSQQMMIARLSLAKKFPELKLYLDTQSLVDDNITSIITSLANIKRLNEEAEAEIIMEYRKLLDRISVLEAEINSLKLKEKRP